MISFLLLIFSLNYVLGEGMQGHLKPLGKQRPSEGTVDILEQVPKTVDFFDNYVLPGKPVLLKRAAKQIPAFSLWTDEYLKNKFGNLMTEAERGKKETRKAGVIQYSIGDFVDRYKNEDIYMVHSLPKIMRDEISLLPCMSCGGYTNVLQDIVVWFSSGGTKSVFHNDATDNINCLFSGTKDLYMVDKKYEDEAHIDVIDGGYSSVDVDKVDLNRYPRFATLPWYSAHMEAGDCLFIPYRWLHQVRSYGRNIAVNVWFMHIPSIDRDHCKTSQESYLPMTNLTLKSVEAGRYLLMVLMKESEKGHITKKELGQYFVKMSARPELNEMKELWDVLDKDENGFVTKEELKELDLKELKFLTEFFPSPGDGETEDEGADGPGEPSEEEGDEEEEGDGDPDVANTASSREEL